tara:strand:+ start:62 stop:970 length:909 start_codon:yes stop_codon:yes gene_type:complete
MQLIKNTLTIEFVKQFNIFFRASLLALLFSITIMIMKGIEPSIDFIGGTTFNISFTDKIEIAKLRQDLQKTLNKTIDVVVINGNDDSMMTVLIKLPFGDYENTINKIFNNNYPDYIINQQISIGPKIGNELKSSALNAIMLALVLISFYIAIRFDRYYALGSLAALIHDILITIALLSLFNIEFSITIIAALLTIVGYSLNDTIVIYDRIRENMNKLFDLDKDQIINRSLNESLNRTFITSFTTLIVVVILYFLGGDVLQPFAFALIIGVLIGTYSSIFIASPIMLYLEKKYPIPEVTDLED